MFGLRSAGEDSVVVCVVTGEAAATHWPMPAHLCWTTWERANFFIGMERIQCNDWNCLGGGPVSLDWAGRRMGTVHTLISF